MGQRVLMYLPARDGLSERWCTEEADIAKEMLEMGRQDKNSHYAGAYVVKDPKEYPRYGYKECSLNGVVRDDTLKSLAQVRYKEYLNSFETVEDLDDESQESLLLEVLQLRKEMESMRKDMTTPSKQREADEYLDDKNRTKDDIMTRKPQAKKKPAAKGSTAKSTAAPSDKSDNTVKNKQE